MEIWTLIVKSNTFNFIFLILILFAICKKAKIGTMLENAKNKVKEEIENSTKEKEKSISNLAKAHASVANTEEEVKEIFSKTEDSIENLKTKIEQETQNSIEKIEENSEKLAKLEENKIFSGLSKQTALASIELAKKHIIQILKEKPQYHEKFINKSIEELKEVQYDEK